MRPCKHNERERSYIDVYSSEELCYAAVKHGYRYFFLELYIYDDADYILLKYVTRLAFSKIKHSNFPAGINTDEEKRDYISQVNMKMNFKAVINDELTVGSIEPSPEKRTFFKQVRATIILTKV